MGGFGEPLWIVPHENLIVTQPKTDFTHSLALTQPTQTKPREEAHNSQQRQIEHSCLNYADISISTSISTSVPTSVPTSLSPRSTRQDRKGAASSISRGAKRAEEGVEG